MSRLVRFLCLIALIGVALNYVGGSFLETELVEDPSPSPSPSVAHVPHGGAHLTKAQRRANQAAADQHHQGHQQIQQDADDNNHSAPAFDAPAFDDPAPAQENDRLTQLMKLRNERLARQAKEDAEEDARREARRVRRFKALREAMKKDQQKDETKLTHNSGKTVKKLAQKIGQKASPKTADHTVAKKAEEVAEKQAIKKAEQEFEQAQNSAQGDSNPSAGSSFQNGFWVGAYAPKHTDSKRRLCPDCDPIVYNHDSPLSDDDIKLMQAQHNNLVLDDVPLVGQQTLDRATLTIDDAMAVRKKLMDKYPVKQQGGVNGFEEGGQVED